MIPVNPLRFGQRAVGQDPMDPIRLPPRLRRGEEAIFIRKRPEKNWYDGFEPLYVWNDGSGFTVRCKPSRVQEVIPQSGIDCVVSHAVTYGGEDHTSEMEIPIPDGHTLICKVQQDKTGVVLTGVGQGPELQVVAEVEESAHWYPDDPEGSGSGGVMFFPLYRIDRVDGVAEITFHHWGPVVVRNDLWTGENLGTGSELFKEHAETEGAVYKFRSVKGRYGIEDDQSATELTLDFDAENVDQSGEDILVDPPNPLTDTPAQFRQVDGRGSYSGDTPDAGTTEQINLVTDNTTPPGIVRALGNGFTKSDTGVVRNLVVNDGLVTAFAVLGSGGDLNLYIDELDYDLVDVRNAADTGSEGNIMRQVDTNSPVTYYWRGGLYLGNSDNIADPGGAPDEAYATFLNYTP